MIRAVFRLWDSPWQFAGDLLLVVGSAIFIWGSLFAVWVMA